MDGSEEVPPGWARARLGEICDINPRIDVAHLDKDAEVAFVPMAAVEELSNKVDVSRRRPLSEVTSGFTRFASGDVLFAKITPCMENGKIAVVPNVPGDVAFGSTEFHVLRCRPGIRPSFVHHYIARQRFRTEARGAMSGAVGQQRVPTGFMREAFIPVPPTGEQARIVAEVEALFADLDEAEAALGRAQDALADYGASLLHAACTGALTAAWRVVNPQPAEDGPALLRRVLAERRAAWEGAELARLAGKGKPVPKGDAWKARYEEPQAPDADGLPVLPDGWVWASLEQLTHRITSGSRDWGNHYAEEGPGLIRAQNIRTDALVTDDLARVRAPGNNGEARTRVALGDLLVTITGANVTKSALVNADIGEAFVSQHVGLCRPVLVDVAPFMHLATICGSIGRKQLMDAAYGAGKPGLNLQDLGRLRLPLPPLEEQGAVMAAIKDEGVDGPRGMVEEIAALRQSILHAAFTGRLVPQDSADESAAVLLTGLRDAPTGPGCTPRRVRPVQDALL